MDSIKKKMEKLANETAEAEARIAKYEGGQHISDLNKWNSCRQTWLVSYLRQIHNELELIMLFWDQWIYNLISSELVVLTP